MRGILSIMIKETKLLIRDPGGLVLLFILPAVFILILSISLQGVFSTGSTEKMDVLVIDSDRGDVGKKIIKGLEDTGNFRVVTRIGGRKATLEAAMEALDRRRYKIVVNIPEKSTEAARFDADSTIEMFMDPALSNEFVARLGTEVKSFACLTSLDKTKGRIESVKDDIDKLAGANDELREAVDKLMDAVDELKEANDKLAKANDDLFNAYETMRKSMSKMQAGMKQKAPPEMPPGGMPPGAGTQPPPEAAAAGGQQAKVPPSIKKPEKIELTRQAADVTKETLPEKMQKPDVTYDPKIKGLSIKQHFFASGEVEQIPNSVQQTVPGWTLFALFWIAQILAMNLLAERQSGAFRRLLVSPLGRWRYFGGKIIPFFVINLVQALFMFGIGVYILPLLGADALELQQVGAITLLTVTFSFVSIGFGFLVAAFSRTLAMGATLAATLAVVMAAVGGIMVPKFVMPHYLQAASFSVPHGWALEGYLDILVRGRDVKDILPNVGILLIFALVSYALAMLRFRAVDRNE